MHLLISDLSNWVNFVSNCVPIPLEVFQLQWMDRWFPRKHLELVTEGPLLDHLEPHWCSLSLCQQIHLVDLFPL